MNTGTTESPNWIVVDIDGSWHGLDTSQAVRLTDDQIESIDTDYAGEINDFLSEHDGDYPESPLVAWDDLREATALALRGEGLVEALIERVLTTLDDAVGNNAC